MQMAEVWNRQTPGLAVEFEPNAWVPNMTTDLKTCIATSRLQWMLDLSIKGFGREKMIQELLFPSEKLSFDKIASSFHLS